MTLKGGLLEDVMAEMTSRMVKEGGDGT